MNAQHTTDNLTVHCKVKDYAAWRANYDAQQTHRASAGIANGRVYRRAEDTNDLVVLFDVTDPAKARTWSSSPDLKASMEKGGVIGSPTFRFAA